MSEYWKHRREIETKEKEEEKKKKSQQTLVDKEDKDD